MRGHNIIRVHRPELSAEERRARLEHIKKAAADLIRAAEKERRTRA